MRGQLDRNIVDERNIAITALVRTTRRVSTTRVVGYGHVKHERHCCYDNRRRCHEQDNPSVVANIGRLLEDYPAWTLPKVSKLVEYVVE